MSDVTSVAASPDAAGSSPASSTAGVDSQTATVSAAPALEASAPSGETTAAPADPGPIPYARFKEVNDQLATLRWAKDVDQAAVREAERIGRLYQTDRVGYMRHLIAEALLDPELSPQIRSLAGATLAGRNTPQADPPIEPDIPVFDANGQQVARTYSDAALAKIRARDREDLKRELLGEIAPIKQTFEAREHAARVAQASDALYEQAISELPLFKEHEAEIAQAMADIPGDAGMALHRAWAKVVLPKLQSQTEAKLLGNLKQKAVAATVSPGVQPATQAPKFKSFEDAMRYYADHPAEAEAMANSR